MKYEDGITVTHQDGWQIHFHGSEGEVMVSRRKFAMNHQGKKISYWTKREDGGSLQGAVATARKQFLQDPKVKLYNSRNHTDDFIQCMKSRKKPIASEVVGGGTAICCLLMNLAYYHQQPLKWDPKKHQFRDGTGDPKWLTREYREGFQLV